MKGLVRLLREPSLDGMDVDGENRLELHHRILEKKLMLKEVFAEFHHIFHDLDQKYFVGVGLQIELGAGVSPMRDSYPEVMATDIVSGAHLDKVVNAESMDLTDNSVRVIFGQNCFHHFPNPDLFFCELERVLEPGGGALLLEPYHGPFATFLFKRLFKTEGFDKNYNSWQTPVSGPMNGANQALSYIVFVRDRDKFELKHPSLKVVEQKLVGNYLRYLISGGLNFRQLLPNSFTGFVWLLEKILSPFNKLFALHHIVVIKKINS